LGEDIVIDLQMAPDLSPVLIDQTQLEAAITNLATNARHAMPQGGRLIIRTRNVHLDEDYAAGHAGVAAGRFALIEVLDSGIGMSQEILDHIFEPFFTTKGPDQGAGLGLATVFGFLKQSGGHINARSQLGVGSSFRLYLPLAVPAPTESHATIPFSAAHGGNEIILVVKKRPNWPRNSPVS
jgi:signal transduction histidine kinase